MKLTLDAKSSSIMSILLVVFNISCKESSFDSKSKRTSPSATSTPKRDPEALRNNLLEADITGKNEVFPNVNQPLGEPVPVPSQPVGAGGNTSSEVIIIPAPPPGGGQGFGGTFPAPSVMIPPPMQPPVVILTVSPNLQVPVVVPPVVVPPVVVPPVVVPPVVVPPVVVPPVPQVGNCAKGNIVFQERSGGGGSTTVDFSKNQGVELRAWGAKPACRVALAKSGSGAIWFAQKFLVYNTKLGKWMVSSAPIICTRENASVVVSIEQKRLGDASYPLYDRPKSVLPSTQVCIGQETGTNSWVVAAW